MPTNCMPTRSYCWLTTSPPSINIEGRHGAVGGEYQPFNGIVLTDTFQIAEVGDTMDAELFPQNNDRIIAQQSQPIRVIVGNPPTSRGRAAPTTTMLISRTPHLMPRSPPPAAKSTAKLKSKLYDSYVRAIRWATDRIGDAGIIAYVTNSGWITGNTTAGLRLAMPEEFSALYIYDLRGNQRQSDWRAEGGKIFDDGSQTGAAILIASRTPPPQAHARSTIATLETGYPCDDKLAIIAKSELPTMAWETISPNDEATGEPRDEAFSSYTPIAVKRGSDDLAIFTDYSGGLKTNRDAWVQLLCRSWPTACPPPSTSITNRSTPTSVQSPPTPNSLSRTLSPTMKPKSAGLPACSLKCNADNVSATSRLIGAWRCTGRSARCTSISTTASATAAADCTTLFPREDLNFGFFVS